LPERFRALRFRLRCVFACAEFARAEFACVVFARVVFARAEFACVVFARVVFARAEFACVVFACVVFARCIRARRVRARSRPRVHPVRRVFP
jgi:hypothetical protein